MTINISKAAFSLLLMCLVVIILTGSSIAVYGQSLPAEALGNIVESRETARSYVRLVKSDWDKSTPEYKRARQKYDLAKAKYDGWLASVRFAILSDTVNDLKNDKDYVQRSSEAAKAIKDFADYVNSLPTKPQEKGIFTIISSIVDIGGKIVDKVGDYKKKKAEAAKIKADATKTIAEAKKIEAETKEKMLPILKDLAKAFDEAAQWQDWDKILTE